MDALIITPIKDSLETVKKTIEAISRAKGEFRYVVFNDFSDSPTKSYLDRHKLQHNFEVIHLEEITTHPSPNYKLSLQMAQKMALDAQVPLIIVESDVIVRENTFTEMLGITRLAEKPGLVGVITVDENGNYNFPYGDEKTSRKPWQKTKRSLSFCCTLITVEYLQLFNFEELSTKKDWYDIFISRQSSKLGLNNYLVKSTEVLHLPHSSRPWKQLKYTHPIRYYIRKFINRKDKI